jgi:hypothetical protein
MTGRRSEDSMDDPYCAHCEGVEHAPGCSCWDCNPHPCSDCGEPIGGDPAVDRRCATCLMRALEWVGFYATANDWRAHRISAAEVVARLRRDAPNVTEPTRSERLSLARSIEMEAA